MNKIDISHLKQLKAYVVYLSKKIKKSDIIFLHGDLGSGKTTFAQLLLKHMGYQGKVKSPTYAIYETYEIDKLTIIHMDLYRLSSPEELLYLGIEDIFDQQNIVIIEWPCKAEVVLPKANIHLHFEFSGADKRFIIEDIT